MGIEKSGLSDGSDKTKRKARAVFVQFPLLEYDVFRVLQPFVMKRLLFRGSAAVILHIKQ